ncbi:protein dispatched isoform X2 [Anthonomus grandis grandis]|nr:protein dispatched isoform X2 [Anthonomus grandis grandis]
MRLPKFQDPQLGFSTRGTEISATLIAWENLQKELKPSGSLTKNPKEYLMIRNRTSPINSKDPYFRTRGTRRKQKSLGTRDSKTEQDFINETVYGKVIKTEKNAMIMPEVSNKWQVIQNLTDTIPSYKSLNYHKQFCGSPDEKYSHLVISTPNKENLFSHKNLLSLCRLENVLMSLHSVPQLCISNTEVEGECCKPWSLANYIAALFGRTSCLQITEKDVKRTYQLLKKCAGFYHRNELNTNCFKKKHCDIPVNCLKHDAVVNILSFLSGKTFFPAETFMNDSQILEETILFFPIAASIASVSFYKEIEEKLTSKKFEGLLIVAADFGIKSMLFDEYLKEDARFMALAGLIIFIFIWSYTGSFFLTVMTGATIFIQLIVAYFCYEMIFKIPFFPFMNLLAIIISLGIGADSSFILCKMWHVKKNDEANDNDVHEILTGTIKHAFKSMFVTALTTAVAFWGSYVSTVTAISCFSIFAGTAVILNYLLMISWIPACLVIWEKSWLSHSIHPVCFVMFSQLFCCFKSQWTMSPVFGKCLTALWNGKKELLIQLIIKLRYFWILSFTILGATSGFLVFVKPGIGPPVTAEFQLFRSDHLFEKYDFEYKNKFLFKTGGEDMTNRDFPMPLRFVWGVLPIDNGNPLDPSNLGTLIMDPEFNATDLESQSWLMDFCNKIKSQPFYQPMVIGVSLTSCFLKTFADSMKQPCHDRLSKKDRTPCCNVSHFPFEREVFNYCIMEEMEDIYNGPDRFVYPKTAGAMFSKEDNPEIKAIVVEFDSNVTFSLSYEKVNKFYLELESWRKRQMRTAPFSMKNGFFVSELGFFDLQRELSRGTQTAIFVSMVLATVVLIISTLNPILTVAAIVTITFSILSTIAALILFGWSLNILESLAISSAIGLSVDFSLHYCINYRICPREMAGNREQITRYALSCLMGPSFMAALTTVAAGCSMLFSIILPYYQIGLFLVLIMTISWTYATFFLGSLLATIGPQNSCQYTYKALFRNAFCRENKSTTLPNCDSTQNRSTVSELDRVSFIKRDTSQPLKKKTSFLKDSAVRYTVENQINDQSPSSNVTIIMAEDN